MKQTHYEQPTRESNSLTIGAQSMEIEPSAFVHSSYPRGVCVKLSGYNPESIIIQLLDDYGYEKLQELMRQFATEEELKRRVAP